MKNSYDVIIIGAGAAGLFCAFNTANKGKSVLVLDHANKVGKKILMSGGGRCNFTNLNTTADDFVSQNRHFCKSALSQYTAYDFLSLVEKHNIEYVEKSAGQLFCKHSSKDILNMLLNECASAGVKIYKRCEIDKISSKENGFEISSTLGMFVSKCLVIATGGLSIPTLGASGYGYDIASQFKHKVIETSPSLVPFVLKEKNLLRIKDLSGVSLPVEMQIIRGNSELIRDDLLFTHRGLSGPAVLKISMNWHKGEGISINLLPSMDLGEYIETEKEEHGEQLVSTCLSRIIPKRLAIKLCEENFENVRIKHLKKTDIEKLSKRIHSWEIYPESTEGYRTAEVTLGGVSTDQISSKTMQSSNVPDLYFIGEVLDVTGQLGGYNFQWAWSSAWCASEAINKNN